MCYFRERLVICNFFCKTKRSRLIIAESPFKRPASKVIDEIQRVRNMAKKVIKISDRVKRVDQPGCFGTVKDVREETSAKVTDKDKENSLLINVHWDNGTLSYMTPNALELVSA